MPVSIEDVAKRANVSISTVSRVLNRKDVVNLQTRQRVEEAIEELGYRPNVFARGLMLRKSNIIGLVLPDLHGEFYSEIIRGANLKAREFGYHLMISSVTPEEDGSDVLTAVGTHGLVDGLVVMVSEQDARVRKSFKDTSVPFVVLDGDVQGVKHDSVVIDQQMGAEAMTRHLLENRPDTRIIFIGGHETNLDTIDRLTAFKRILNDAQQPPGEGDIVHLDYSYETAFEYAANHVIDWAKDGASVFAANDEMAAGVIDAAIGATLDVPGDLRVAGFDDTRIAQLTRPRMTTVRVPMAEMGASAIDLVYRRINEPGRAPVKIVLQAELVVRESCGSQTE